MSDDYPIHRHTGATETRRSGPGCMPFLIGIAAYLLIALRQPPEWSIPVWIGLAFFITPLVVGVVSGLRATAARSPLRAGFRAGAWAMAWYTAVSLFIVYRRVGYPPDGGLRFLIGMFVALVYALPAGLVAGLASWAVARLKTKGSVA